MNYPGSELSGGWIIRGWNVRGCIIRGWNVRGVNRPRSISYACFRICFYYTVCIFLYMFSYMFYQLLIHTACHVESSKTVFHRKNIFTNNCFMYINIYVYVYIIKGMNLYMLKMKQRLKTFCKIQHKNLLICRGKSLYYIFWQVFIILLLLIIIMNIAFTWSTLSHSDKCKRKQRK